MNDREWVALKERAETKLITTYYKINLPHRRGEKILEFVGGNFVFYSPWSRTPIPFTFSRQGLNYLLYRLHAYRKDIKYIDKAAARAAFRDNRGKFSSLINNAARRMVTANYVEARRPFWIAAINEGGQLRGLMTTYNPFSHTQVLKMVEDAGLVGMVRWHSASDDRLALFLHMESLGYHTAEFGMVITNGQTGHVALGYHAAIRVDNYVYTWNLSTTRRHLSKIHEAEDGLQTALAECRSIAIANVIKNVPVHKLVLRSKKLKLDLLIGRLKDKPIGALIAAVAEYRDIKGYKTAAEKLLTDIFKTIEKGLL